MAESNDYKPKLVSFPGSRLSPEVLLHRTIPKLDRIKAITIVIQWDDDTYACDWSSMKTSELCMSEKILSLEVNKVLIADSEEQ
jgi:hypothetical protein